MATYVVTHPFGPYGNGDKITDAAVITAILASPNQSFVVLVDGTAPDGSSGGSGTPGGSQPTPAPVPAASDAPAAFVWPITPDPINDLVRPTRALRCDTGGTLVVNTVGGDQGVTLHFDDRETRPVRVTRVLSATGATGIEGMA